MRYIHMKYTKPRIAGALFALALVLQAAVPFLISSASAGSLTNTLVRVDRLAASQATDGMVCAKSTTTAVEAHVQVTFPGTGTAGATSFGVNATAANWTTTTADLPSGATAWIGIGTATAVSGATVTFPSGDMVVGTLYCFNFAAASTLSTPTAAAAGLLGSVTTQDGSYLWGKDSQAGLHSTTASYTVNSNCSGGAGTNSTLTAGTEGYNLGASVFAQGSGSGGTAATSGTGLVFDNTAGTAAKGAGLCSTNYQTIANSNGTANAAQIHMLNNAAISGVTKAASDYTDLETFVGAGLF
jgi:hypothetical protein